ncbi:hypothetical protein V5O48_009195 [Marasmius crinis-equi]|uniref:WD40 repeat-like protein n=1 Tax=Marasmius crinis-equi TaxID=585013 RepID=A0ABR3FBR0_9AGAR
MSEPKLVESSQVREISRPRRQIRLASDTYIQSLASLPAGYAASTSSPSSDVIQLFDKSTLTPLQQFEGHQDGSTFLRAVQNVGLGQGGGKILVSSGKDGSIRVWDERTNSCGLKLSNPSQNRPILSFDVSANGLMVAGGTALQGEDALILYWDPRQPAAPIRTHGSTHSDDITALHFKKDESEIPNLLLSASSDGLISTSNADEDDEDEAVVHVGNWGCSVSQIGWLYAPAGSTSTASIWAASDMETFSTWTAELDRLQSLELRAPSVHTQSRTWVTDYLIACDGSKSNDQLTMFMGSNEGDIAQVTNQYLGVPEPTTPWTWSLETLWTHGHEGVVRSVLWDDENRVLVTGGEDAKLTVWPGPSNRNEDVDMETLNPGGSGRKREYEDIDVDEGNRKRRR